MGSAASPAGGASILSLGLGAYSSIEKGKGEQAASDMRAARAERAAEFGKLQSELTDTHFREELNTTLGNIDVIRAAAHIDPTSPTTAAIEDSERATSERQRTAAELTLKSQTDEDLASAKYLREAGKFSLGIGYLDAATKVAAGVGKMAGGGA